MQSQPLTTLARFIPSPLTSSYRLIHDLITGAEPTTVAVGDFLDTETPIAWQRLLKNVHPKGTAPGCVVASPSKAKNSQEPNYWSVETQPTSARSARPRPRALRNRGALSLYVSHTLLTLSPRPQVPMDS